MINPDDLRDYVIKPVLEHLGLYSLAAEQLMLLTYIHESTYAGETRLKQVKGPALGPYQCEPPTHRDVYRNFLYYRPDLKQRVMQLCSTKHFTYALGIPNPQELQWNLAYATAVCRICYWRVPERLPEAGDVEGLTKYWSTHYQTSQDPNKERQFASAWNKVRGMYA